MPPPDASAAPARAARAPSPRRARNRRGEGALLREDILRAAARLLAETGDEDKVTVRAVATAAGVAPPSVYLHFPDKDALIFSVCEVLFADLDAAMEAAVAGIDDPVERMIARGRAYVRFGLDHREHYRVLFMHRPEHHPAEFDTEKLLASSSFAHLYENVHQLVEAGLVERSTDPFRLAVEVWALVHGFTSLVISHPSFPWPDLDRMVGEAGRHLLLGHAPAVAAPASGQGAPPTSP